MTTYAQLEAQAELQKAEYLDPATGQKIHAASMIYNEEIAKQIDILMKGKSKVVGFDVDDIDDADWVSDSLYSKAHLMNSEDEETRFLVSADRKFEDTTLGGSYVCNPRPGYTPYADPPKRGLLAQRNELSPLSRLDNIGAGVYHTEALQDNYQIVDFRFGKPEYNSLLGYLFGHFSAKDALIANTGRYSPLFYKAGQIAGTGGLFLLLGPLPAVSVLAVSYVGGFINGILSTNPHKFWYVRPAMYLYWKTVSNIVNQILSYKGVYTGGQDSNPTTGESMPADKTTLTELQAMAPGIFDENGAVNVRRVINRAERINQRLIAQQAQAVERSNSYEALRAEMRKLAGSLERDPTSMSEETAFNLYSTGVMPDASDGGAADDKVSLNTLIMGTAEQRFSNNADIGSVQEMAAKTYADQKDINKKVKDKAARFWEFLKAEWSDGSAFASFRVDHTGPPSETFSNSSMKNDLGTKFNEISATGRAAYFALSGGNIAPMTTDIMQAGLSLAAGTLSGLKLDGLLSIAGAAFADIPEGWENAAYSGPSLNYNFRLQSPSGHPLAQLQHIWIPFAMVLAGVVPHAAGKAAYTQPFFCEVYDRIRGITRNGMIQSVVFTRGVSNLGHTRNKDVLAIDVQISVKDLSSALYMPIEMGGLDPRDSIHTFDSTYTDYIATLGGATLGQNIYKGQKLRIRARQYMRGTLSQATSVDHWAAYIRELPGVRDLDIFLPDSGRGN